MEEQNRIALWSAICPPPGSPQPEAETPPAPNKFTSPKRAPQAHAPGPRRPAGPLSSCQNPSWYSSRELPSAALISPGPLTCRSLALEPPVRQHSRPRQDRNHIFLLLHRPLLSRCLLDSTFPLFTAIPAPAHPPVGKSNPHSLLPACRPAGSSSNDNILILTDVSQTENCPSI